MKQKLRKINCRKIVVIRIMNYLKDLILNFHEKIVNIVNCDKIVMKTKKKLFMFHNAPYIYHCCHATTTA